MRKWEIEGELKFLGRLKTNTLSAQEDLALLRLTQSLSEQYNKLNKDKELIAEKAKKDGVIFGEDGRATDESNQEALEKANEQLYILLNEEIDMKQLDIETVHKIKNDNLDELANIMTFTNFASKYLKET